MSDVKVCQWFDLNRCPLASLATTLPTEPQPLTISGQSYKQFTLVINESRVVKMNSQEKWKILTPLQKLHNNVGDLVKIIAAASFKLLPKEQKIAKSGHTVPNIQCQKVVRFGKFSLKHISRPLSYFKASWKPPFCSR